LHPLLVHLPIGILLLAAVIQARSSRKGYQLPLPALRLIWLSGLATALLSLITGFLVFYNGTYQSPAALLHLWLGILLTLVTLFVTARVLSGRKDTLLAAALAALVLLILLTGYFGGLTAHTGEGTGI
jgi:uncharacterized membrane protein